MHWQKLNKLPMAPPSRTTSQFFGSNRGARVTDRPPIGLHDSKVARHVCVRPNSCDRRDEDCAPSFERYQAIKRGNRGNGSVNAARELTDWAIHIDC